MENRIDGDEGQSETTRIWKIIWPIILIVVIGIMLGGFSIWWFWPSSESDAKKKPIPEAITDQKALSNGVFQISRQMERVASGMSNNLVKLSGELSELVASNQIVMSQRLDNLSVEVASNYTAIRAEIPGIVERSVEEKVAKAMEPFQKLLTNPPPPVQTQAVTLLPAVICTNNNMTVVNIPPPPPQPAQPQSSVATTTVPQPSVMFQNNNTMVIGGPPGVIITTTNAVLTQPYWMRRLW